MDSFDKLIIVIIAIIVDQVIKRAKAKKKSEQEQTPYAPEEDSTLESEKEDYDEDYDERPEEPTGPVPSATRKLQEYIKQFEKAQREASQGTLEPAMPPPIPESSHGYGNNVTVREVAENIVQLDVVDAEYLMDEFEISKGTAYAMLAELQQLRVIGRDMGDGEYDVLVQDIDELNNLLSREPMAMQMAAEKAADLSAAPANEPAQSSASDKQSQLKILEERARKAREEAAAAARQSDRENGYTGEAVDIASPLTQHTAVRSISRETARRGFIWAKVIDEPRFKKRWTALSR